MARGKPKICPGCGRKHWSLTDVSCPKCRGVAPSQTREHRQQMRGGQCLGTVARRGYCDVRWRHLPHTHCPTVGCGRPMSVYATVCGVCCALDLLAPLTRAIPLIKERDDDPAKEYLEDMIGLPGLAAL